MDHAGPSGAVRDALAAYRAGRLDAAEALARAAHAESPAWAAVALGAVAAQRGQLAAAEAHLYEAIAAARSAGDSHLYGRALQYMIMLVLLPRGRFAPALAAAAEAARLDAAHAAGERGGAMARAWVAQLAGDWPAAHAALAELGHQAAADPAMADVHAYLAALLAIDEGLDDEAAALLDAAYDGAERLGSPHLLVGVRVALSRLCRARGEVGDARTWAAEAVAAATRAGAPYLLGAAHVEAAWAGLVARDWPAATAALDAAEGALRPLDAAYDLSAVALARAALAAAAGPDAEAAWLSAAARLLRYDHAILLERERSIGLPLALANLHAPQAAARAAADDLLAALRRRPPAPLAISGLGGFAVRQGRRPVDPQTLHQRRGGELLRFLLVAPGRQARRETALAALWPGRGPAALPLLHQATSALRHALEPGLPERVPSRYLAVERDALILRLPPGSRFDLDDLAEALAAGDVAAMAAALAAPDATLFPEDGRAEWVTAARERAAALTVRALTALAARRLADDPAAALACADRARALDPWAEEATLQAMRACAALGDRPGALRRFASYRRSLRRNLGLAPRGDISALAAELASAP